MSFIVDIKPLSASPELSFIALEEGAIQDEREMIEWDGPAPRVVDAGASRDVFPRWSMGTSTATG